MAITLEGAAIGSAGGVSAGSMVVVVAGGIGPARLRAPAEASDAAEASTLEATLLSTLVGNEAATPADAPPATSLCAKGKGGSEMVGAARPEVGSGKVAWASPADGSTEAAFPAAAETLEVGSAPPPGDTGVGVKIGGAAAMAAAAKAAIEASSCGASCWILEVLPLGEAVVVPDVEG